MLLFLHLFFSIFNFVQLQFYYIVVFLLNHSWWNFFFIFFLYNIYYKHWNFFFFFFLSFYLYLNILKINYIPNNLLMGYNNIHPLLFYNILIFFNINFYNESLIYIKKQLIVYFSIFTLLLGGLWGMSNSVWGFFWVNDQIELILLMYIYLQLIILHLKINKKLKNISYILFISLLIFILLLRWGLIFTRHNFINLKFFINFFKLLIIIFYKFNIIGIISYYLLIKVYLYLLFFIICKQWDKQLKFLKIMYLFHIFLLILFLSWLKNKTYNYTFFFFKYSSSSFFFLYSLKGYLTIFYIFFLKKKILYSKYAILNTYIFKYFFNKNIFTNYTLTLFFFFFLKSNLRFILNKYTIKSSRRWT